MINRNTAAQIDELTREQAEILDMKLSSFYRPITATAVALGASSLQGMERGGAAILLSMLSEDVSTLRLRVGEFRREPSFFEFLFRNRRSRFSVDEARRRYNLNVRHLNDVRSKLNLEHILYLTGI